MIFITWINSLWWVTYTKVFVKLQLRNIFKYRYADFLCCPWVYCWLIDNKAISFLLLEVALSFKSDPEIKNLETTFDLTKWSLKQKVSDYQVIKIKSNPPEFPVDAVSGEDLDKIIQKLSNKTHVAFRIYLDITRKKPASKNKTYFDIFITKVDGESSYKPIFIREGIVSSLIFSKGIILTFLSPTSEFKI